MMDGKSPPILSVIILNWNGVPFLPRCLQSLREQTLHDVQIILVDNGSTDDSIALTRRDFPEVDIVDLGENLGYAQANNKAALHSQARYLLFLNNDTYLDSGALAALVSAAEARPHIAIFAPQQRDFGNRSLHGAMGMDILGYPSPGKAFYADGAALFIRRETFHALGGFDPHYFIFFEEADLCWRAWLWGHQIGIVHDAIVFHKAGGTVGSSVAGESRFVTSKTKRRMAHRNQLATLLKNYSTPMLCLILPFYAFVTGAEVALLVLTGQRSAVREAYLPAWRDLLGDRHYLLTMRRRVQESRQISDWTILHRMTWKLGAVRVLMRSGTPKIT